MTFLTLVYIALRTFLLLSTLPLGPSLLLSTLPLGFSFDYLMDKCKEVEIFFLLA